jgi:hypothetical protein
MADTPAFVPGFDCDIFVSYPMEGEAWTQHFVDDLKEVLAISLEGQGLSTYFAKRNWELGQVSHEMLRVARKSALFVAILTPSSFTEGGKRFLDLEWDAFRESGPVEGRFCPIPLNPIPQDKLNKFKPNDRDTSFWNQNCAFYYYEDDVPIILRWDSGEQRDEYRKRVEKVAWYIKKRLEDMRRRTDAAPANERAGPFVGKKVVLAEKEPQVEAEWTAIRDLLRNDGVTVLSSADACADDERFSSAIKADVTQADLFVQLLSPSDEALNWIERQGKPSRARLAFDAASAQKMPLLQWCKAFELKPEVRQHLDKDLLDGPNVMAGGLEEFKRTIREQLKQFSKPVPENTAKVNNPANKPYLYITADKPDLRLARDLQAAARKLAVADVMTEAEEDRAADFEEGIGQASAVVFLHGDAQHTFIDRWLKVYVRKTRLLEHRPRLAVLYLAPPKKAPDDEPFIPMEEMRVFGSQEQFTVDGIRQLLAELDSDSAA